MTTRDAVNEIKKKLFIYLWKKRHAAEVAATADRAKFISSAAQTVSVAGRRRARLKGNPELLHSRASGDGGGGGGSEYSGNFGAVAARAVIACPAIRYYRRHGITAYRRSVSSRVQPIHRSLHQTRYVFH